MYRVPCMCIWCSSQYTQFCDIRTFYIQVRISTYVLCTCMYVHVFLCDCVSPFPTAVSLPLSKACEVLSEQLQTLGLQQDKVRCVYVGDGDRRETVVSCFSPSLHLYLLFSSPLPCHFLCSLYLPTLVLWRQGGEGGDRWGGMVLGWGMSV